MNKLILSAAAARARFSDVKAKGFRKALNDQGAIDLASIMVGVLVIGIIGGVIAATVFAVIPWSQDQAAQQALGAVATAESVQYSFASGNAGTGNYLSETNLNGTTNAAGKSLLQASNKVRVVAVATAGAVPSSYVAYSLSSTGNIYSITDANPSTVVQLTPAQISTLVLTVSGTTGGLLIAGA